MTNLSMKTFAQLLHIYWLIVKNKLLYAVHQQSLRRRTNHSLTEPLYLARTSQRRIEGGVVNLRETNEYKDVNNIYCSSGWKM